MFESMVVAEPSPVSPWAHSRLLLVDPVAPDADDDGRDVALAVLADLPPSAATMADLAAYDPGALDPHDRVLLVELWERQASWLAAQQQQAIVAVTGPAPTTTADEDFGELEIACALRLSPATAARRVDIARELTGRLRETGRALERGLITFWHALSLVEAVAALDDEQAERVEQLALDGAESLALPRFRARLRRAVIAVAPKDADERHEAAVAGRRVVLDPQPDGMAWLSAYLTAPEAIAAYRALDDRARAAADQQSAFGEHASVGADPLTGNQADPERPPSPSFTTDPIDVRRADAFLAAILDTSVSSGKDRDRTAGLGARVLVTMDLPTALRFADNPGHLDGYGEIPPELARQLAADALWQRLLVDPATGHLLDFGRTTYRPPQALADYVRARDVTCRFPNCSRAAMRCDLDHAHSWQCEGSTCSANLGALCRRHHRAKTHAGWKLESHPDGTADWISPSGHHHRRPAVNHSPEHISHLERQQQHADNRAGPPDDVGDDVDPAVEGNDTGNADAA